MIWKNRKALRIRKLTISMTIKGTMTRAPVLTAKTIKSGREVDVEAEATEEEIVEAEVETETEIEMATNEKKTAGKREDIKSRAAPTIMVEKRTNSNMTIKTNFNVRSAATSEAANEAIEAAEASAVEEITKVNTETKALDNMTKRKSNIKKKRMDIMRAVK